MQNDRAVIKTEETSYKHITQVHDMTEQVVLVYHRLSET